MFSISSWTLEAWRRHIGQSIRRLDLNFSDVEREEFICFPSLHAHRNAIFYFGIKNQTNWKELSVFGLSLLCMNEFRSVTVSALTHVVRSPVYQLQRLPSRPLNGETNIHFSRKKAVVDDVDWWDADDAVAVLSSFICVYNNCQVVASIPPANHAFVRYSLCMSAARWPATNPGSVGSVVFQVSTNQAYMNYRLLREVVQLHGRWIACWFDWRIVLHITIAISPPASIYDRQTRNEWWIKQWAENHTHKDSVMFISLQWKVLLFTDDVIEKPEMTSHYVLWPIVATLSGDITIGLTYLLAVYIVRLNGDVLTETRLRAVHVTSCQLMYLDEVLIGKTTRHGRMYPE